jgi:A/G-specific adenine glycosylase
MSKPVEIHASAPAVRRALLRHYERTARELPWRRDKNPYRIWVSEVMLQQTRVDTVTGYYDAWLQRFPTVRALAAAEEDEVLKAWEGLGYYRRARNLHRGAMMVRDSFGGSVPGSYGQLRRLPGVGDYTAGAVASIAFGEVVPAVDGNVRRVLARLFDVEDPRAAWLRKTAAALVDPDRPGDWNQAVMDLGATLCTPTNPACDACPLAQWCRARASGTQAARPAPQRRKPPRSGTFATAVVVDPEGRRLVIRRPEGGLLGRLWAFPDVAAEDGKAVEGARAAARGRGVDLLEAEAPRKLAAVRHRFTHIDATYLPVLLRGAGPSDEHQRWLSGEALVQIALPVAQRKIAAAVEAALHNE